MADNNNKQANLEVGTTYLERIGRSSDGALLKSPAELAVLDRIGQMAERNGDWKNYGEDFDPASRSHNFYLTNEPHLSDTQKLGLLVIQNELTGQDRKLTSGQQQIVQDIGRQHMQDMGVSVKEDDGATVHEGGNLAVIQSKADLANGVSVMRSAVQDKEAGQPLSPAENRVLNELGERYMQTHPDAGFSKAFGGYADACMQYGLDEAKRHMTQDPSQMDAWSKDKLTELGKDVREGNVPVVKGGLDPNRGPVVFNITGGDPIAEDSRFYHVGEPDPNAPRGPQNGGALTNADLNRIINGKLKGDDPLKVGIPSGEPGSPFGGSLVDTRKPDVPSLTGPGASIPGGPEKFGQPRDTHAIGDSVRIDAADLNRLVNDARSGAVVVGGQGPNPAIATAAPGMVSELEVSRPQTAIKAPGAN